MTYSYKTLRHKLLEEVDEIIENYENINNYSLTSTQCSVFKIMISHLQNRLT
jgi:hypothetical protein